MAEEMKKLIDIKNIDELDFESMELTRGETPEDIKQKCYHLCKDYLGGIWLKVTIDEIKVERITGGVTNQLYCCTISKPLEPINDEPKEVVIRIYGRKYFNNLDCDGNERLTDVIIALLVSENKLGPKIYGLFESGQIQQYYKHRPFRVDEQNDPKLVNELSRKLARVHAMDVPIKKSRNWIFETFDSFYETSYQKSPINQLIEELNLETLKKYDLKKEIDWIKKCIIKTSSPFVFCHNDFRGNNIMITKTDNKNTDAVKDKLVLCDFEYSSYGYRGYDFGSIFAEWGRTLNDFKTLHNFPNDCLIKPFIEGYLSECIKIHGKQYSENKLNSMEQILKEVKVFALVSNLFMTIFCSKNDDTVGEMPFDKKVLMQFAEIGYKNYFHLKQKFINENVIEEN